MMPRILLALALLFSLGCAVAGAANRHYGPRRAYGPRSITVPPNSGTYYNNYYNPFYHPYSRNQYRYQHHYNYQYGPHHNLYGPHFDLHW